MSDRIYFITIEDADKIINMFVHKSLVEIWSELNDTEKIKYLTQSGLILNNMQFRGTRKVDINQPYEFPRFLSGTCIIKNPVWEDYQDYQIAQAIRACKLSASTDSEVEIYGGSSNIASEKSGSTQITYFEPSESLDITIAERNGLDMQTYKLLEDWLTGGY